MTDLMPLATGKLKDPILVRWGQWGGSLANHAAPVHDSTLVTPPVGPAGIRA